MIHFSTALFPKLRLILEKLRMKMKSNESVSWQKQGGYKSCQQAQHAKTIETISTQAQKEGTFDIPGLSSGRGEP